MLSRNRKKRERNEKKTYINSSPQHSRFFFIWISYFSSFLLGLFGWLGEWNTFEKFKIYWAHLEKLEKHNLIITISYQKTLSKTHHPIKYSPPPWKYSPPHSKILCPLVRKPLVLCPPKHLVSSLFSIASDRKKFLLSYKFSNRLNVWQGKNRAKQGRIYKTLSQVGAKTAIK